MSNGTSQEEIEGFEYDLENKHEEENRESDQTPEQYGFKPIEQEHKIKKNQWGYLKKNPILFSIKRKTIPLRHTVTKMLAPHVFRFSLQYSQIINKIPRPLTMILEEHFRGSENLVGAEIGVARGDNALNILQTLPIQTLYLIDPYAAYREDERGPLTIDIFQEQSLTACYIIAHRRLSKFKQAVFVKKPSEEAVSDIKETLDFAYIDGNHDYNHVRNDINLYYLLVKNNGIIGGHDYVTECISLRKAVDDFVRENNLSLKLSFPDWWILKTQ